MRSNHYFSVQDILSRKHFEHARVIAGHRGVNRQVKWVHVVEAPSIRNLLNGCEMILTTGLALKEEEAFLSLLKQLIDCRASSLCIELDTNISIIPEQVLRFAEEHDFPIIVFEKEVPFVSITQDIHTMLINHQYNLIKQLDAFGHELNKKLLDVHHSRDILDVLYEQLRVPVLLKLLDHEVEVHPRMRRAEEQKIRILFEGYKDKGNPHFVSKKVLLFEKEYAELLMFRDDFPFNEYELLLLDRTATAIAQYLMRELYFHEKQRVNESKWVRSWLKGGQPEEKAASYLSAISGKIHGGVVCLCSLGKMRERENMDLTYFTLIARGVFEQQGFNVLTEREDDGLTFILLDNRPSETWKRRASDAFEKILKTEFFQKSTEVSFAAGSYQAGLMDIHKSYQAAKECLSYRSAVTGNQKYNFYDELHLYRLIANIHGNINLLEMVRECFAPLLEYDKAHSGSLLITLKVYLDCQGSKQETAKQLYIVRQTLYHRLKKIEELLGKDFMQPEKRVAIEFLLHAYDYLKPVSDSQKAVMR
ncbi:PucR family transcriptional regulator [Bacillus salacetis]|nr:PucR family transcriptional regulator [Bacillus salacetis]